MELYARAMEMKDELIDLRRTLHQIPEVGSTLPKTAAFVTKQLTAWGYEPQILGQSGIVAQLQGHKPGKVLMLRADMDGLNITEQTGLPFAAKNGHMHACGHDMHTAMLLGAAKLLKEQASAMAGTVKFLFQPNEEGLTGAQQMLEAGVLESPGVDAAMALHVHAGTPSGAVLGGLGTPMAGCTLFRIHVRGTGCHGAMPHTGVDPINIASHIYLSLQTICERELSPTVPAALTIGCFQGGSTPNVIPETAVLEGSIRALDAQAQAFLFQRVTQIAQETAKMFRGSAQVQQLCSIPPLKNDSDLVQDMLGYIRELHCPQPVETFTQGSMGSEDFSVFCKKLPCCYLILGAGTSQENPQFGKPMHNEGVVFNEDILPLGSAVFAHCALRWLENHLETPCLVKQEGV